MDVGSVSEPGRSNYGHCAFDVQGSGADIWGDAQHDSQGFFVRWPGDRTIGRIRMDVGPSTGDYPRTCGIWVKGGVETVTFVNC